MSNPTPYDRTIVGEITLTIGPELHSATELQPRQERSEVIVWRSQWRADEKPAVGSGNPALEIVSETRRHLLALEALAGDVWSSAPTDPIVGFGWAGGTPSEPIELADYPDWTPVRSSERVTRTVNDVSISTHRFGPDNVSPSEGAALYYIFVEGEEEVLKGAWPGRLTTGV